MAKVRLHGMAYGGAAVGRLDDGVAVFVQGALSGELAEVEIIERKASFARARLVEVLEPAAERSDAPCPHFLEGCGGCQWQHAAYDAQLAYKQQILADQLRRGAGISDPPLLDPVPSLEPFGYRNSAEFHLAESAIGFHREGTRDLVDVLQCPLMEPPINAALTVLRDFHKRLPDVSLAHVRNGVDALQVALLTDDDPRGYRALAPELAAQLESAVQRPVHVTGVRAGSDRMRGLHGDPWIHMELAGRRFRVSALSFFQVNSGVAEVLARQVAEQAHKGDRVLDLFSGVGTFGMLAADQAQEVVGIEAHPAAVADAQANLAEAGVENARFELSDVAAATSLAGEHWDLAILDPPRAGCPRQVLEALDTERVAYVSCDPSTLARDLKILQARGFTLHSAQLLDMFPQTYHLETLAVLSR